VDISKRNVGLLGIQAALKAALASPSEQGIFLSTHGRKPHCCDPAARTRQVIAVGLGLVQATLKDAED